MSRTTPHRQAPQSKPNCHQNCHSENHGCWMVRDGTDEPANPTTLTKDILRSRITVHPETGCWLYKGAVDRFGYGRVFLAGKERKAPKVYYEVFVGPVPRKARLIHALSRKDCIGAACCNPAHLEVAQSFASIRFARRICPKGHLIEAENAVIEVRGDNLLVRCRECRRLTWRKEKRHASARGTSRRSNLRATSPPLLHHQG
jgi:hypothetical protein